MCKLYIKLREVSGGRSSPERLRVESRQIRGPETPVFHDEETLIARLIARDPLITRIRPFAHRFEPIWWRYGSRRVLLSEMKVLGNGEDKTFPTVQALFSYGDFSSLQQQPRCGDFILPNDGGAPVVLRVQEIKDSVAKLQVCFNGEDRTMRDRAIDLAEEIVSGYLVRKPDALDYYAGMFAVFAYHFLISDGPAHKDFPADVHRAAEMFPIGFKESPSRLMKSKSEKEKLPGVQRHLIRLIVWLSLGGYHYNTDGEYVDDRNSKWSKVRDEIRDWVTHTGRYSDRGVENWNLLLGDFPDENKDLELSEKFQNIVTYAEWEDEIANYMSSAQEATGLPSNGFLRGLLQVGGITTR